MDWNKKKFVVAIDLVDGMRLCLWTAAINGPFVHPQVMYK
jgi:hypothetical protein